MNGGYAEVAPEAAAKAEECRQRGNEYVSTKEYDKAIAAYSEAIELNPSQARAYWLNRAIAYRLAENWEAAANDAGIAVEIDPTNVKTHYILALCLLQLKQYDRALEACEVGLLLQADNKAIVQIQRDALHAKEQQEFRQGRLARLVSGFGRETPHAPSRDSSSSESSSDGFMAPFRPPPKQPRPLTEADAPYQELCIAASSGDLDECRRLLQSGAIQDLNWSAPEDGNTPLHIAADSNHEPVARALLEAKADPAQVNDFGLNPFHLAERGTDTYKLLNRVTRRTDKGESRRNARKTRGARGAIDVGNMIV